MGLHELKSVPKWIVDKKSAHAGNTAVVAWFVTRSSAASSKRLQAINIERDVRFFGWAKVRFDS